MQVKLARCGALAGAVALAFMACPAFAQLAKDIKGTATVRSEKKVTPADRDRAFHDAELDAVRSYFDDKGSAEAKLFDQIRDKVSASIDDYFLHAVKIADEDSKDRHQYSITVKGDVNVSRLDIAKQGVTLAGSRPAAQKSLLTFVFVARAQSSETVSDPQTFTTQSKKVTGGKDTSAQKQAYDSDSISEHNASSSTGMKSHSSSASSTSTISTSGQGTKRTIAEHSWRLIPAADLSAIVTGVFSNAGYKVREAEYVTPAETRNLFKVAALQKDYATGMDLKPETKLHTLQGLQAASIPYLALATLDVGFPEVSANTGLRRVYVTVNAELVDVTGRSTVAKVGPEQFQGEGPTDDVARTDALKNAAGKAAQELLARADVARVH